MIRSLLLIGLTFFCFSGSFTFAQEKILIDFGKTGDWRSLSTPGNWNSLNSSAYWQNLTNKAGGISFIDFGFVPGAAGGMDSFNGPAGDTSLSAAPSFTGFNSNSVTNTTFNAGALGDLGQPEAVFDYFTSSVFAINELNSTKVYKLTFFGSRKYNTNATTVYTMYDANPGNTANTNGANILSLTNLFVNDGPVDGNAWRHNTNRVAELIVSNRPSVHIGFIDADGISAGYLNAMSIEEMDTQPPSIVLLGSDPLLFFIGDTFTDPGATVTDNLDATRTITGTGNLDLTTPGTYLLTYATSDAAGNPSSLVTRTVVVRYGAARTVLIDFGREGNWRSLSAPGNWNSLDASTYWQNLVDATGTRTTLDFGFVGGAAGNVDSISGPAGDTSATGVAGGYTGFNSNSVTNTIVDAGALGNLAQPEAAFDYFTSSAFVINELNPSKTYRLTFFGSRKYNTNATTVYSAYDGNPGNVSNSSNAPVLSSVNLFVNDGPINGNAWQHNTNRVAELVISNRTSLHIGFVDADGSSPGYLNAMSIAELNIPTAADTNPPVITVSGNTTETVVWGSSYVDAGATATDNGLPVSVISNTSGVNTSVLGSYQVTYSATDAASNIASASRTVNVVLPVNADVAGPDGLSPLLRYALGASSPDSAVTKPSVTTDADDLILTALIRTSGITVAGQASTDLSSTNGGFVDLTSNPNGVLAADQSNLLPGTERREFRTPKDANRKFIRLIVSAP